MGMYCKYSGQHKCYMVLTVSVSSLVLSVNGTVVTVLQITSFSFSSTASTVSASSPSCNNQNNATIQDR